MTCKLHLCVGWKSVRTRIEKTLYKDIQKEFLILHVHDYSMPGHWIEDVVFAILFIFPSLFRVLITFSTQFGFFGLVSFCLYINNHCVIVFHQIIEYQIFQKNIMFFPACFSIIQGCDLKGFCHNTILDYSPNLIFFQNKNKRWQCEESKSRGTTKIEKIKMQFLEKIQGLIVPYYAQKWRKQCKFKIKSNYLNEFA